MKKHFLVMGLLAAVAVPVSAEGLYVYGDAGQSKFSSSDSDSTYDLGLGYAINKNFSFEFGYNDLGGITIPSYIYYHPELGDVTIKSSVGLSTIQASFLGMLPLNDSFDVHARLGYARIKTEITVRASAQGESASRSDSDTENKAVYGVGIGYKVNESIGLRLDYNEYNDVEISTTTVGLTYAF